MKSPGWPVSRPKPGGLAPEGFFKINEDHRGATNGAVSRAKVADRRVVREATRISRDQRGQFLERFMPELPADNGWCITEKQVRTMVDRDKRDAATGASARGNLVR